jgi:hypothetical protein
MMLAGEGVNCNTYYFGANETVLKQISVQLKHVFTDGR